MSSDRNTSPPLLPPEAVLDALPLAAAILEPGCGAGDRPPLLTATNAAWRALWRPHLPTDAEWRRASGLEPLLDHLVDAAQATALVEAIAAGRGLDLDLALDLDGPVLWRGRGAGLGAGYLLTLEPVDEPEHLAAGWLGEGTIAARATGFRYVAGLGPDGSWRIRASAPDFRHLLGIEPTSDGWLHHAARASRRALRTRHLRLIAGTAQSTAYDLDLPNGRGLTLTDTAMPVRHPGTGEVIGLVGWARLAGDGSAPDAARPAATAEPSAAADPDRTPDLAAAVQTLNAIGVGALVSSRDGRILAANERAARRLGRAATALHQQSVWSLLLTEEAIEAASFATLLNDLLAPGTDCEASTIAGRDDAETGLPLVLSLQPLELAGDRLVLVTLDGGPGSASAELPDAAPGDGPAADSRLRDALYFDPVTGLPNRFLCLDRLRQNIARTAANGGLLAILVLEIDRLPLVERSFGRATAEALLEALARRLAIAIGDLDTAAHLGGARFAVLAGNLAGADEAARIAQHLLDQLSPPVAIGEREIGTSGRVGIAVFPDDGDTAEALLGHAETALERLPKSPELAYHFYSSAMNTASSDRLLLEQQLIDAVERDEFLLLYQPQISFASSRIVGMEALIRWRHPELGMVPPAEFIPLAEATGAIVAIGEWVMRTACRELAGWLDAGVAPLRLALNISGRQYNDANLVPSVRQTLEATGFPPHLLELELTESVIMEDVVDAARRLGDLHDLGVNLAVDDFGTGYSSLSYLKRFPIRSLKVDRSFVRDIAHNESSASIARAIIAFGSALGLKVIAEGVESHDQYDILRGCGCDELQGYLFSRPIPAEDARKLATEHRHLPLVRA